jgi:ectoine hydroxylase-related dioxygenase (phytanoyl-CoA dioxygenase family)
MARLTSNGCVIDTSPERFGELRDSSALVANVDALRSRLDDDGYLFIRSAIPREAVMSARLALLKKLATAGGLAAASSDTTPIASDKHELFVMDQPSPWWIDLTSTPEYRALCHHPGVSGLMKKILGDPLRVLSYYALRFMRPGGGTAAHADRVYFHGTPQLHTVWIPIGDVPRTLSPLMVLEGSHRNQELRAEYSDHFGRGMIDADANALQRRCGGRWLTTDFKAGDVLIFGMYMLHGSIDNQDPAGGMRISTDVRIQRADQPIDPRFDGDGSPKQACLFSWNSV